MPVLADAYEGRVDRRGPDPLAQTATFGLRIRRAVDPHACARMDLADQALLQIEPETGRVIGRQANVLIQMEHRDPRPIYLWLAREMRQEGKLRGARGHDDARRATLV
jgi:hypothetical protein